MLTSVFNEDNLGLFDWQYTTKLNANMFYKGEVVFLKSNPKVPLKVIGATKKNLTLLHKEQVIHLPAACLMKYRYASQVTWRRKYNICLN